MGSVLGAFLGLLELDIPAHGEVALELYREMNRYMAVTYYAFS